MEIFIDKRIRDVCPQMQIGVIRCNTTNRPTSEELWSELNKECVAIKNRYELLQINQRPAIAKTRELYKALGKDPNRYRVSSEALCRRAVKGMELHRINTLVDIINLLSIHSGYSIGGFDGDKIQGDMYLGVGEKDEKFEGIGRGLLNIEGLPVYRDSIGGIGSPTSDEERTKITLDTTFIHININAFEEEMILSEVMDWSKELLMKYTNAKDFEMRIIK